jgi:methylenetetrahydrofolate reductase (NADPH)
VMGLLDFFRLSPRVGADSANAPRLAEILSGYSIEVTPRTAAKVARFGDLLPGGTRVYIAHIHGTPIGEMVATAHRLRVEGYPVISRRRGRPGLAAGRRPGRAGREI